MTAQVLLATGDGTTNNAGDAAIFSRLSVTLGHTVTLCRTNTILSNAAGKDLVVVTASGNSGSVNNLSGLAAPVWIAESFNWDDQGWASSPTFQNAGLYLRITRSHHPITQTLPVGLHRIYTAQVSTSYLLGNISAGEAACLAVPPNDAYQDRAYLATYDVGDRLAGGGTAAYRICLFGVWDLGPTVFSSVGWELFDRSIGWLLGTLPDCAALQSVGTGAASASAGPYSAANHWTASDATDLSGRTFLAAFDLGDLATRQDIWAHSSSSSGWVIGVQPRTGTYGPTYPELRVTLPGGAGDVLFDRQRLQEGRNAIAVSLSGGTLSVSVNGREVSSSGVTYVAPSGASHYVGRSHSTDYGTGLRMVAAAVLDSAVTSDELQYLTDRSAHGLQHGLTADVTGHASLRWHVDFGSWDGVAGTLADDGGGTGSCTLTEVGSVQQTALPAWESYAYGPESLNDTMAPSVQGGHYHHDSWARLRITTDSPAVRWSGALSNPGNYLPLFECSIDVGGVYSDTIAAVSPHTDYDSCSLGFFGLGSASKTIDIYPGMHTDFNTSDHGGLYHAGQLSVEAGSAVAIVAPSAPTDRLVMIGDSILAGLDARPAGEHSFAMGVRRALGGDGWQTTVDAWRSRALGDVAIATLVTDTITRCDGTAQNVVIMQLGTNDYGDNRTAAAFQGDLAAFCDQINAADSSIDIYVLTALDRSSEGANGAGSTLPDFRAAAATVAGSRAWVTIIDGTASMNIANLSDGLHPANSGMAEVETAILAALPPAAGAGAITANDLTAGTPTLEAPSLSQSHGLAAVGETTGAPTLDAPGLAQDHSVSATEVAVSAPILESPAISQAHALAGEDLTASAPTLDSPAVSQSAGLVATSITTGAPESDSPALSQVHALAPSELPASGPVLDSPAVSQAHTLSAVAIDGSAPVLDSPALSQAHGLTATKPTAGGPVLESPALTEIPGGTLVATPITTGAPVLEAPGLTQSHALTASDVFSGAPMFGAPSLSGGASLTATGLTTGAPTLGTPPLSQVHAMSASDVATGAPLLGSPSLAMFGAIAAVDLTVGVPVLGEPTIAQSHQLATIDLILPSWSLDSPTLNDAAKRRVVRLAWTHAPGLSLSVDWSHEQ